MCLVALLAEGVDRNFFDRAKAALQKVALLAEGVDRNILYPPSDLQRPVALLAEGVDRNFSVAPTVTEITGSPSSRRAWIEISLS